MARKINYFYDFYESEILNGIVPELLIDEELLTQEDSCFKENHHKVYRINDDLFYEVDRNQTDLLEFRLDNNEVADNEKLIYEIKENAFFVMVNSIIILSQYQWNTITNKFPTRCLVCDNIIQDPNGHIRTDIHVENMEKYKPLKKFNLHITRLIGDKYHCAVCNEVYEKDDSNHVDSERHIEKMLFATNRATDVFYDVKEGERDTPSICESGFDSDDFYDSHDFNNDKSTIQSYASVTKQAKTKTTEAPTFIEHVIGNKTFSLHSDAYHMILRPNCTEFYCMLCILFDDINNTSDHCKSEEHLQKLKQCEVMNEHEGHFIRKVTTKYYHCGTCNNLQVTETIERHLEMHDKKHDNKSSNKTNEKSNKEIDEVTKPKENKENELKTNENNSVPVNELRAQSSLSNVTPTERPIINTHPYIYNDIIINRFNCNIRVSFMSYNMIVNNGVNLFCPLCNVIFPSNILHFRDPMHIVRLETLPFQPFFGINLVRLLQQYAHCAICNVLVNVALIHMHTTDMTHLFLLNKALNPNNKYLAMNPTNVIIERPNETKMLCPSENLQSITTNSETSSQTSIVETDEQNADLNQTDVDLDDIEDDIDHKLNIFDKLIYLRITKKALIKVSYVSYHTLVNVGDGSRYCFLCSHKINTSLSQHIKSKAHMNQLKNCKFIMTYEKDLLRQSKMTYHCCVCNVLLQKSEIENHLTWPPHKERALVEKKVRKRKNLDNIINVHFQTKEESCDEEEELIEIVFKISSAKKENNVFGGIVANIPPGEKYGGKIVNIPWEAWQGITTYEHGVYCLLCHDYFFDIDSHLEEDSHKNVVSKRIEKKYFPACVRQISQSLINCVTCHLAFPNKKKNLSEHMIGKKHLGNIEHVLESAFNDDSLI